MSEFQVSESTPAANQLPGSSTIQRQRPSRALLGLIALGVLLLAGSAFVADEYGLFDKTNDDTELVSTKEDSTPTLTSVVPCTLPTHVVPEQAFRYGAPDGWIVEMDGDTLAIMADTTNTTATYIHTIRLQRNLSAAEVIQDFGAAFRASAEDTGGSLSLGDVVKTATGAKADIAASLQGKEVRGNLIATNEEGFITLHAQWAPTNAPDDTRAQLAEVGRCFTRITALSDEQLAAAKNAKSQGTTSPSTTETSNPWGALVSRSDSQFSFQAPATWQSNVSASYGESPVTSLAIDAPAQDAAVAFLFNLGRYGVTDPAEFAKTAMRLSYSISATLSNAQSIGDGVTAYDFSGTFKGKNVRGAVAVKVEPYQTFFAHYVGVQIADAEKWDRYAPTLNTIQSSIRLTDAGRELSSLPALPNYSVERLFGTAASSSGSALSSSSKYKQEVEDRASEKWADAMRGYESAESPSTGQSYDVPLNAWNPTGHAGPGYYRLLPNGGTEKLTTRN